MALVIGDSSYLSKAVADRFYRDGELLDGSDQRLIPGSDGERAGIVWATKSLIICGCHDGVRSGRRILAPAPARSPR